MKKQVLATAKPNFHYEHIANLRNITLEARLVGSRVMYYEVRLDNGREHCLRQETVHEFFQPGRRITDQPFLVQSNRDFYAVLNRHLQRNQERFKELKNTVSGNPKDTVKLVRTRKLHRTRKP
jgi:hypothetical protein